MQHELEKTRQELNDARQELEQAKKDTAAASAQLLTMQQTHEEHAAASMHAQEDLMQQVKKLQQSLVLSDARAEGLSIDLGLLQARNPSYLAK